MNAMPLSASPLRDVGRRARRWLGALAVAVAAFAAATPAIADVPGRVGRVSFLSGDVQSYAESDPQWKVAYVNEPVTSRNSIFVGDGSRAEISIGSTTLAIDGGTQVDVQQLDDDTFAANVVRGRVSVRIRRLDAQDQVQVAVPGADFALLRPGRYRLDALDGGSGITVFEGQAGVQGDGGSVVVDAGRALRVVAGRDPNGPPVLEAVAPTTAALDDWVVSRESRFRVGQAERYVSPEMTGYEDLDANGRWANEAEVGPVWYPTTYVVANWAPYRYGRWAYVPPWGYTWVDDAPWGFAPFHYGRWLQIGGRWGWCPGAYVARPVYAPALVGFYGGDRLNVSFAVGSGPAVGWYPLAPWDRFEPHYPHGSGYLGRVNNIALARPPARFGRDGDWNRVHGGTIAPQEAFASQRSISQVVRPAPRDFAEQARPVPVAALPHPLEVPGAVRRGPEAGGAVGRPEFRPPRQFAQQPERFDRGATVDRTGAPGGPGRPAERNGAPFGDRPSGDGRPAVTTGTGVPGEVGRPQEAPRERAADREDLRQRVPDRPAFARPVVPNAPSAPVAPQPPAQRSFQPVPQQAFPQGGTPAGEGQGSNMESGRFVPRSAPVPRVDGGAPVERFPSGAGERRFERRPDVRSAPAPVQQVAPPPQAPQPVPQVVERPRPAERPAFERPARIEAPVRIERPAPQAAPAPVPPPAPPAPAAAPHPQPPTGVERGGPNRDR